MNPDLEVKLRTALVLVAAAAAAAALAATVGAETHPAGKQQHRASADRVAAAAGVRHATWACQDHIGQPRTRAVLPDSRLPLAVDGYLTWMQRLWETRLAACEKVNGARVLIVNRLRAGLRGYPLEAWAERFERAGRQWNVSPYLMAAISGTESTFGLANSANGNAWGIGPGIPYRDFGDGIDHLARLLATSYPLDSGSLTAVGNRYAACGSCWGGRTGWFMQSRFGASPYALRYPRP